MTKSPIHNFMAFVCKVRQAHLYNLAVHTLFWSSILCLFGISLVFSWTLMDGFVNTDLRNRIVGTRVALAGLDPYYYQWKEGDPLEWLDSADHPDSRLTRITVSPIVILTHIPLALMPYHWIVRLWFCFCWVTFGYMVLVFCLKIAPSKYKIILLLAALFSISPPWIMHLVVGQIYVFYAALIVALFEAFINSKKIKVGILVGLIILIKPAFLPLILLLGRNHYKWIYSLCLIVFGIVLSSLILSQTIWSSYLVFLYEFSSTPRNTTISYTHPKYVFMTYDNLLNFDTSKTIHFADTSVLHVLEFYGLNALKPIIVLTYIFVSCLVIWFILVKKLIIVIEEYYIYIFLLVWLFDFFSTVPRYSYYDTLTFVLVLLLTINERQFTTAMICLLLTVNLFLWHHSAWLGNFSYCVIILTWTYGYLRRPSKRFLN